MKEINQLSLFCYVKPLFENIFHHFWPRHFKAQNTAGLDHNKWSFYRRLSRGCLVVVGTFFRYIGLSANRQAKNSYFAKWPLEAAKWSGVIHEMLMDWYFDFLEPWWWLEMWFSRIQYVTKMNGWIEWTFIMFPGQLCSSNISGSDDSSWDPWIGLYLQCSFRMSLHSFLFSNSCMFSKRGVNL
jgi:hypothetical protein